MRIGPLTLAHFDKLKTILENYGAPFEVSYDQAAYEAGERERLEREPRSHPTYRGTQDFLFLDIATEHALLIRGEAEKLGIVVGDREIEPLPEAAEYLCPRCAKVFPQPGVCDDHDESLLEFSDWVEWKRRRSAAQTRWIAILILPLVLAFILWEVFSGHHPTF